MLFVSSFFDFSDFSLHSPFYFLVMKFEFPTLGYQRNFLCLLKVHIHRYMHIYINTCIDTYVHTILRPNKKWCKKKEHWYLIIWSDLGKLFELRILHHPTVMNIDRYIYYLYYIHSDYCTFLCCYLHSFIRNMSVQVSYKEFRTKIFI